MVQNNTIQNAPIKEYLYSKAAHTGIPLAVTFELSPLCNFNCTMCYIHQSAEQVKQHPRKMVTCEEWLALAEELKKQGTLYILLTGGEPLLWPDFWTLYEKLYRMGFLLSVNSNGSLIDEKAIAKFRAMPPNQINITLYGASDDTYFKLCGVQNVHSRVVRAIEKLQSSGIIIRLNCSLTPQNVMDMDCIFEFADSHHLTMLSSTYMYPPVRNHPEMTGKNDRFTPEESARYRMKVLKHQFSNDGYQKALKMILAGHMSMGAVDQECMDPQDGVMRCYAGKASCWMTWDGYLLLCGMMLSCKADLRKGSFTDAWNQIRQMSENTRLSGKCAKCDYQSLCHPCAAKAFAENGRTDMVPSYLCEEVREMRKIAENELKRESGE